MFIRNQNDALALEIPEEKCQSAGTFLDLLAFYTVLIQPPGPVFQSAVTGYAKGCCRDAVVSLTGPTGHRNFEEGKLRPRVFRRRKTDGIPRHRPGSPSS